MFIGTATRTIDPAWLWLDFDAFDPLQWVTSIFAHGGVVHLIGNMVFLWVFGMIVEGKIGWLRFLCIYFGIGVVLGAVAQLLFANGAALGASGVVFGLLGICLVWAPENEVTFAYFFMPVGGTFDARVSSVAVFYAVWNLFWMAFLFLCDVRVISEFVHLMGIVVGVPIGGVMLRKGLVDCEKWDWFSVRRGDHKRDTWLARRRRAEMRDRDAAAEPAWTPPPRATVGQLRAHIAAGHAKDAAANYPRFTDVLEQAELRALCDLLFAAEMWQPCRTALREYVRRFPGRAEHALVRLAAIATRQRQRPRQALRLLAMVPRDGLPVDDAVLYDALSSEAESLRAETPLELADDENEPWVSPTGVHAPAAPVRHLPPEQRNPARAPVASAGGWSPRIDLSWLPENWPVRLAVVLLAGLAWWRVASWIGVPQWESVGLGALAAVLLARWMALSGLR